MYQENVAKVLQTINRIVAYMQQ